VTGPALIRQGDRIASAWSRRIDRPPRAVGAGAVAVEATGGFETVLAATAVAMQLKTILPACSWPAWAKQRESILGLIIVSLLCGRRGMKPAPLLGRRLTRRQIAHLGFSRGRRLDIASSPQFNRVRKLFCVRQIETEAIDMKSQPGGGMRKVLIVFVAVASVLLISAFMYFIRPQPCDGIFERTAPQLKVKLGFIEANGEWAIGKEKIQQVDKDSQDVRPASENVLHLAG
jgi:hypothetical protein